MPSSLYDKNKFLPQIFFFLVKFRVMKEFELGIKEFGLGIESIKIKKRDFEKERFGRSGV